MQQAKRIIKLKGRTCISIRSTQTIVKQDCIIRWPQLHLGRRVWLRWTSVAFAHARWSILRGVVVAGAHTGAAAARTPRYRATRPWHRVSHYAGESTTQRWRHHHRRLHRGRRCTNAERIGGGRQQSSVASRRRRRGKRAGRGQRMFFHLQGAYDDRFAIVVSAHSPRGRTRPLFYV